MIVKVVYMLLRAPFSRLFVLVMVMNSESYKETKTISKSLSGVVIV